MTDTDRELARLRELAKAATPGEWEACKNADCSCGKVWSIPGDFPVWR